MLYFSYIESNILPHPKDTYSISQSFRQHSFLTDEYHYLNVSRVGTFTVYDIFDCTFECLSNPSCLSVNMAAFKGAKAQAAQALVVKSYCFFIFKCLCERWARETSYRDTVTAVIYCYITTLRGTWLWTFSMWRCYVTTVWIYKGCMGENVKSHFSRNFDIFSIKNDLPQCLGVFSIILPHFSTIRSLLSELSHFEFPLLRKSKGWTLHSGLTPARKEKKNTRSMPAAPVPPQNYSTGSSAPFQLNSKPNSSPQRTLQSCKSKKASGESCVSLALKFESMPVEFTSDRCCV